MQRSSEAEAAANVQAFLAICTELGCEPPTDFLACLQSGSRVCKLTGFDREEQLYAVLSLLPHTRLDELDLSGLMLGYECWVSVMESCAKCPGLQVLSIKECGLGSVGTAEQKRLAELLGNCSITVLDASRNDLANTFAAALADSPLLHSDRLHVLDLSENNISCDGAVGLAAAMELSGLSCSIKQLDLSFNSINDRGACALASMLSCVPLMALELEGNQVGDIGGLAVAAAMKGTLGLQRLNVNHNRFNGQTLAALADALRINPGTLQELAVAGCQADEADIAALLRAATGSRQLQLLDVRGVQLGNGMALEALVALLTSAVPLVTLRLDVASKAAAEQVAQALSANTTIMHLIMGGPVPEHVLSYVGATLSSNTLSRLSASTAAAAAAVQSPAAAGLQGGRQQSTGSITSQTSPAGSWGAGAIRTSPQVPPSNHPNRNRSANSIGPYPGRSSLLQNSPIISRPSSTGSPNRRLTRTLTAQTKRLSVLDPMGLEGLSAGGMAKKAAEVFRRHDTDGSGYLDAEEMMSALQDLGMLEGMKARALGKFLSRAIKEADTNGDGRVTLDEFIKYYDRLARYYSEGARHGRIQARKKAPPIPIDAASDPHLRKVFKAYCRLRVGQGRQVGGSVQHINAAQFMQLARDAGLVDPQGPLSQCAVDIVFTKSKPPGNRRLSFKEFLEAVAAVADEAGWAFDDICDALGTTCSPPFTMPTSPTREQLMDYYQPVPRSRSASPTAAQGSRERFMNSRVGPVLPGREGAGSGREGANNAGHGWQGDARANCSSSVALGQGSGSHYGASADGYARSAVLGTAAARASGEEAQVLQLHTQTGSAFPAATARLNGYGGHVVRTLQPGNSSTPGNSNGVPASALPTASASDHSVSNPLYEGHERVRSASPNGGLMGGGSSALDVLGSADGSTRALEARVRALEAKLLARGQGTGLVPSGEILPRLSALEASAMEQRHQLEDLRQHGTALQAAAAEAAAADVRMAKLEEQVKQLRSTAGAGTGRHAVVTHETLTGVEHKLNERQTRIESALMQVAQQVDAVNKRLREEQESTMRALEALLANHGKC